LALGGSIVATKTAFEVDYWRSVLLQGAYELMMSVLFPTEHRAPSTEQAFLAGPWLAATWHGARSLLVVACLPAYQPTSIVLPVYFPYPVHHTVPPE
jgi:hypothetical protein